MARFRTTVRRVDPNHPMRPALVDSAARDDDSAPSAACRVGRVLDAAQQRLRPSYLDYRAFFFECATISSLRCRKCSELIQRRGGWRRQRLHLVSCIGIDFKEQYQQAHRQQMTSPNDGKSLQ